MSAKMLAAMTSKHVSAVTVAATGTGYVTGDVVSITHAGIFLAAKFEVTASAGAITALRILSSGAISNRLASATVSAGGSGYVVGDVLEVTGGTQREKAKVQVATLSGSAVATVTVIDSGGAYSVAPSSPAATVGVGPAAFAGDDACTLTLTMTGTVGTTGLALQGGTGSGGTADITLTETGWTTLRSTHDFTHNAVTNERTVILKGDAAGHLNKPIVGWISWTESGGSGRSGLSVFGMRAHNPATAYHLQDGISAGINTSTGVLQDGGGNILCDEAAAQEMDFWAAINDRRIFFVHNNNAADGEEGTGNTDSAQYMHAYLGFYLPFQTENEDPYPLFVGASSRAKNIDPSASSANISGIPECYSHTYPSAGGNGWWYYRDRDSTWYNIVNLGSAVSQAHIMWPMGRIAQLSSQVSFNGSLASLIQYYLAVGSSQRTAGGAAPHYLMPAMGGTWMPIPLAIVNRDGSSTYNALDVPRGIVDGVSWITATDSAGARVSHFAEDYLTIGSDRYRVFGNHVQHAGTIRYQFIAVREDI
jgi:hypothetical protein